ncbi:MAG: hypothetical protein HYV76_00425 [Candidatus Vogelbacteria bacterium]|nr:hypothetical protein [Candidatus Vogelbacteria bacterium]
MVTTDQPFIVWGFVPLAVPRGGYRRTFTLGRRDWQQSDLKPDTNGFFLSNDPTTGLTVTEIRHHSPPLCFLPVRFAIEDDSHLYIDDEGGIWLGNNQLPIFGSMSRLLKAQFTRHLESSLQWRFSDYWINKIKIAGTVMIGI